MTILNGTEGRDQLNGGPEGDILNGLGGSDQLRGGLGFDRLNGGDGDDWMASYSAHGPDALGRGRYRHGSH
jgi:Ca2+-binding RTX toxin-like protein